MKRTPCNLGWTDHAYRRFKESIRLGANYKCNFKHSRGAPKRGRFISIFNELVFHKPIKLPF